MFIVKYSEVADDYRERERKEMAGDACEQLSTLLSSGSETDRELRERETTQL